MQKKRRLTDLELRIKNLAVLAGDLKISRQNPKIPLEHPTTTREPRNRAVRILISDYFIHASEITYSCFLTCDLIRKCIMPSFAASVVYSGA